MEICAPLAHRLGFPVSNGVWEDLSFRYLNPTGLQDCPYDEEKREGVKP